MISFFENHEKFVFATGSEISLYELQPRNVVEELVFEEPKPQSISELTLSEFSKI